MKVYPYVLPRGPLDPEQPTPLIPRQHDDDEPWPRLLPPRFPSSTHPRRGTRGEDDGVEDGGGGAGAEDGAEVEAAEAVAVAEEEAEEAVEAAEEEEEAEAEAEPLLPQEQVMQVSPMIVC